MNMDLYNDTFDDFLNLLPQDSSVIELGCGPGNVIRYFLNKRKDLKILGVDLAPAMLKQAANINPEAEFLLLDIRNLSAVNHSYDAVVGAFCLPYLSTEDLEEFFSASGKIIRLNGLLYISCMEGESLKSGYEKTSFTGEEELYIYYHQREYLELLLSRNHLIVEKFYTKDYPESDGSFTTDLVYIARKVK